MEGRGGRDRPTDRPTQGRESKDGIAAADKQGKAYAANGQTQDLGGYRFASDSRQAAKDLGSEAKAFESGSIVDQDKGRQAGPEDASEKGKPAKGTKTKQ